MLKKIWQLLFYFLNFQLGIGFIARRLLHENLNVTYTRKRRREENQESIKRARVLRDFTLPFSNKGRKNKTPSEFTYVV